MQDKMFITVQNQQIYNKGEYGDKVVQGKAELKTQAINLDAPHTDVYNIRLNEVKVQDNRWKILPFEDKTYSQVFSYLA